MVLSALKHLKQAWIRAGSCAFAKGTRLSTCGAWGLKGDLLEDAKKAQWYINRIVKTLEAKDNELEKAISEREAL